MITLLKIACWATIIGAFISKPYFDAMCEKKDSPYEKQGVDTFRGLVVIFAVSLLLYNCGG